MHLTGATSPNVFAPSGRRCASCRRICLSSHMREGLCRECWTRRNTRSSRTRPAKGAAPAGAAKKKRNTRPGKRRRPAAAGRARIRGGTGLPVGQETIMKYQAMMDPYLN